MGQYPYFKIRRDDPEIAAVQIIDRVKRHDLTGEWFNMFLAELLEYAPELQRFVSRRPTTDPNMGTLKLGGEPIHKSPRFMGIIGHAEPVIIPADKTDGK